MSEQDVVELAAIPRGDDRLRVVWDEYNGARFLPIRLFWQNRDGEWRPSKKGITVKRHELDEFVEAVNKAREVAAQE